MGTGHQYSPLIARILGFTGWPLISLVTPLLVTPVISRISGQGWSSVVTAMSIGTFCSAMVTWGWSYVGPARVAAAGDEERRAQYFLSIWTRCILAVVIVPLAGFLSYMVAVPTMRVDSSLMAVAFTLGGLSPQWYCIGIGRASLLGLYDTLPRAIGTLAALPLVLLTGRVWPYPCLLILGTVWSLVAFARLIGRKSSRARWEPKKYLSEISATAAAALASLVGSAYSYAPVPIATALLIPAVSSSFASADQLYRYLLFSVMTLGNALQGWVLEVSGRDGLERQRVAIVLHALLGMAGGVFMALFGGWLSGILFGSAVASDKTTSLWYGVTFFCISSSTPFLRNILIPRGRARAVLVFSVVSAVAGLALMFLGALQGSASRIALGLTASEFVLALCVILIGTRLLRRSQ